MVKDKEILSIDDSLVSDIRAIIEDGRRSAYESVNRIAVLTYWNIGKKIVEEEQNGESRAEYGKQIINLLSSVLLEYGNNFSARNLRHYRQFFLYFPDLEIWYARVPNLGWTHFRRILSMPNPKAEADFFGAAS